MTRELELEIENKRLRGAIIQELGVFHHSLLPHTPKDGE